MNTTGYYRFPAIHGDNIVFVCEDDLFHVKRSGGTAQRLTTNLGWAGHPRISPDGQTIAFSGMEDGGVTEIYTMPAQGGPLTRVTWLGTMTICLGWAADGRILFRSSAGQAFPGNQTIFAVSPDGGDPEDLGFGMATELACCNGSSVVIGRWTGDPARWKRYRGGRAGVLLIDEKGKGDFRPLIQLEGNLASPMWINGRVFFLSDHEGVGNIYSCTPAGKDLQRHTDHDDFYVRFPGTDGRTIVYHAGGDLYQLNPATGKSGKIPITLSSPRARTGRKFVSAAEYLESVDVHPAGHSMLLTTRGRTFTFGHWEGAVRQHCERDGVRTRLGSWLADGQSIVLLSDASGEERIEIHDTSGEKPPRRLKKLDFGRARQMIPSPDGKQVALSNNRGELWVVDLKSGKGKMIDRSQFQPLHGFDWSPDNLWLVYAITTEPFGSRLRLAELKTGKVHDATGPGCIDADPVFDPDGKFIYFNSFRAWDPVMDFVSFDYNFPRGFRPCLIPLRTDVPSPFVMVPHAPGQKPGGDEPEDKKKSGKKKPLLKIDLAGMADRVMVFPVMHSLYSDLAALPGGRLLYITWPLEGRLQEEIFRTKHLAPKGTLRMFDLNTGSEETLSRGVNSISLCADRKTVAWLCGKRIRVLKAGDKGDEKNAGGPPGRKSGWIDLSRIRLSVIPSLEWKQMFQEAWSLQKENFWTEDMSGINWQAIRKQYAPIVDRVASRGEFSDLMWEVQGELGTSHAYEYGGDYNRPPSYPLGFLGADLKWDPKNKGYRIEKIVSGNNWEDRERSPLRQAGLDIKEKDVLMAIDGMRLDLKTTPGQLLVHRAGIEVELTIKRPGKKSSLRRVTVKTLRSEMPARYRSWVEDNRAKVSKASKGKIGYIHVPDCGARGYAEFHRAFLMEVDKEGLIVDVRFNGGGHVSGLLLEKLARKRIAFCQPRWGQPEPYPANAPAGPLVALTNEAAGSDGDIFSHSFKLMGLGPLIGKRTWGGVIGINMRDLFIDRGGTTQPQYSFWFSDVGWQVENYGTEPDIEIDIMPGDYRTGRDPQLERGIRECLQQIKDGKGVYPRFKTRPNLARPKLPGNGRKKR